MTIFVNDLRDDVFSCAIKGIRLENDLRSLRTVYSIGASEAVVFYCARMLEAILKDAYARFFGTEPSGALAETERLLHDYRQLPFTGYYWAKGLRLLGNEARHSLRAISPEEADCAAYFLELILTWYLCEFPCGELRDGIGRGTGMTASESRHLLAGLISAFEADCDRNPAAIIFGTRQQAYTTLFSANLTFPILLMEIFISQGDHLSATRLCEALDPHLRQSKGAHNKRLLQLKGLMLSREERLEEALEVLEPCFSRHIADHPERIDDETVGILAGVYKRIWERDKNAMFLEKSHETYLWGWRRSGNTYLGINAATTALWMNRTDKSGALAQKTKNILHKRRALIQRRSGYEHDLSYWDMTTLAEAELLVKNIKGSSELYKLAFSRYSDQVENIAVTKSQLSRLIEKLSLPITEPEFSY